MTTSTSQTSAPKHVALSASKQEKAKVEKARQPEADPFEKSPSEQLCWSERVRSFFNNYPGFSATLTPEAELWSNQELEVYFGSNGDIWPRGKRPPWLKKPSQRASANATSNAEQPKLPPKEKTYPDLKEHFETLGLAETTPHDIIRRHYRRLAFESHPDKHPDDREKATARFQTIAAAFEAISQRLHL